MREITGRMSFVNDVLVNSINITLNYVSYYHFTNITNRYK